MLKTWPLPGVAVIVVIFGMVYFGMPREQPGFCRTPSDLGLSDIVGSWSARYEDHWVPDPVPTGLDFINGVETLVFSADGTYTHTFENATYHYESALASWSLVTSTLDSPKLKMENFKFFAAGETFDETRENIYLMPEMVDLLEFQDEIVDLERVTYPTTGYVYLYLRQCSHELILHQMIVTWRDPDNLMYSSPLFYNHRFPPLFTCLLWLERCWR